MSRFLRILALLLLLPLGLCFCGTAERESRQGSADLALSAESAILISAEDGKILFEKDGSRPMGPASTTKLMTALVVTRLAPAHRVLTVPREAVGVEGSSVYLTAGEQLTVGELLAALLLASANDAATALAVCLCGSVEAFAHEMNRLGQELGLICSHFKNPHGLYDEAHYTCARDLARIAAEALRDPLLRETVATYKTSIPLNGVPDQRLLINHNRLLRSYEGAIGMKTGYTRRTGRTLVSAACREGMTLIAVTLNAPDDWNDHRTLLDHGFSHWERVTFYRARELRLTLPAVGGSIDRVTLTNEIPLVLTLPRKRSREELTAECSGRFFFAPVARDMPLGRVLLRCEGEESVSPLIALESVEEKEPSAKGLWGWLRWIWACISSDSR